MVGGTIQLVDDERQLSKSTQLLDLYGGQQIKLKSSHTNALNHILINVAREWVDIDHVIIYMCVFVCVCTIP